MEARSVSKEELLARVGRRADWVDSSKDYPDAHIPGYQKQNFALIGEGNTARTSPADPLINIAEGFTMVMVAATPGNGPMLHNHGTNETFFVVSGTWKFIAGPEGEQQEIEVGKHDTVSVPTFVPRRFVNVASDSGNDSEESLVLGFLMGDHPDTELTEGSKEIIAQYAQSGESRSAD